MRGRHGLVLVIFAALVWGARYFDFGRLQQLDVVWTQVINLAFFFGLALCIVGTLGRLWSTVRRSG